MLAKVLKMSTADEIHAYMHQALIDAGLGRVLPSYEGPET